MKKILTAFSLLTFFYFNSGALFAYAPARDVLWRNPGNPIYTNQMLAQFQIEEVASGRLFWVELATNGKALIQTISAQGFKNNKRLSVRTFASWEDVQADDMGKIFYSFMAYSMGNNAQPMLRLLRQWGEKIAASGATINSKQDQLLRQYLQFLRQKKKNKSLTEKDSPLYAKDAATSSYIKEKLASPYYLNTEMSFLHVEMGQFYWKTIFDHLEGYALFRQESRDFYQLVLHLPGVNGELKLQASKEFSLSGMHKIPAQLTFFIDQQPLYQIKTLGFKPLKNKLNESLNSSQLGVDVATASSGAAVLEQLPALIAKP